MSTIGILTVCLAVLQPLGESPRAAQTSPQPGAASAAQAAGASRLTPIDLALYDAHNRLTVQLSFSAEVQAAEDLRSEGGVWFRAIGNATDSEGHVVTRSVRVDLKLRLRSVPERIETVAGARMASFGAGQPVDLMRMTTDARGGSRRVTVVNFAQQRFAEFDLGADWFALIGENEVAGLLGQIFGQLTTGGSGERDVVVCDPTFAQAYNTCFEGCRN